MHTHTCTHPIPHIGRCLGNCRLWSIRGLWWGTTWKHSSTHCGKYNLIWLLLCVLLPPRHTHTHTFLLHYLILQTNNRPHVLTAAKSGSAVLYYWHSMRWRAALMPNITAFHVFIGLQGARIASVCSENEPGWLAGSI